MTEENKKTRSKKYELTEDKQLEVTVTEEEAPKEHPIIKKTITFLVIILLIFLIYSFLICPNLFIVKEYKVSSNNLPDSFNGMKIVQLSDIHYGTRINKKQLNKIVKMVNELKPDIIFYTGDLIDKNIIPTDDIQNEVSASLRELKASLYKYAVVGNEDDEQLYEKLMNGANFRVLKNESTLLYYKDATPIMISGFNPMDSNPKYSILTEKIDNIDSLSVYNIVLVHESDSIDNIINYNPDLVLAGGTLGGKVKLFKPLFLPKNNTKYYEDYYQINDTAYYISNGLGTTGVNFRFNNNPSINFYRLYKEEN